MGGTTVIDDRCSFCRPFSCRPCLSATLACCAALLFAAQDPVRAFSIDLRPANLNFCAIDATSMEITYTIATDDVAGLEEVSFTTRIRIVDGLGAIIDDDQNDKLGCLPVSRGFDCWDIDPIDEEDCDGGFCPCETIIIKGKKQVVTQDCFGFDDECDCVPNVKAAKPKNRPVASGPITVSIELDIFNAVAETDETDNLISLTINNSELFSCATGACCFLDGTCSGGMTQSGCETAGGRYLGDATVCGGGACPPLGACCTFCEDCVDLSTQEECECVNGIWHGAGSFCLGDGNGNGIDDLCEQGIPAASDSWLAVLGVVILAAGAVVFRRKPRAT